MTIAEVSLAQKASIDLNIPEEKVEKLRVGFQLIAKAELIISDEDRLAKFKAIAEDPEIDSTVRALSREKYKSERSRYWKARIDDAFERNSFEDIATIAREMPPDMNDALEDLVKRYHKLISDGAKSIPATLNPTVIFSGIKTQPESLVPIELKAYVLNQYFLSHGLL